MLDGKTERQILASWLDKPMSKTVVKYKGLRFTEEKCPKNIHLEGQWLLI